MEGLADFLVANLVLSDAHQQRLDKFLIEFEVSLSLITRISVELSFIDLDADVVAASVFDKHRVGHSR